MTHGKNSNELFAKLFGQPAYKTEEVESEGVKTSFFMCGPNKIELLEATNDTFGFLNSFFNIIFKRLDASSK